MGFERKFKDGDKVKVIDSNSSSYKEIGTIKWYGYPLCLKDPFYKKKIYYVDFKTYSREFYSYQLELVESNINYNYNIVLNTNFRICFRPFNRLLFVNYFITINIYEIITGKVFTINDF